MKRFFRSLKKEWNPQADIKVLVKQSTVSTIILLVITVKLGRIHTIVD
jgi:hypothetical protein